MRYARLKKSPFRTAKWKRTRTSPFITVYTATILGKKVLIINQKGFPFRVEIENDKDLEYRLFDYGGEFDRYEWALVTLQDRVEELIKSSTIQKNPRPPKSVARVACRGLKKRRKYKRGGTAVGVARGRDLCNRVNVSMRTVKRMSSYFARHRASRAENRRRISDPVSPARIADELWGGTPGYHWVKKVLG
jgi:hypothetical protein